MIRITRLLVAALALLIFASACGAGAETTLAGYERNPEPAVGEFSLPAVNRDGEDFAFQADPGELLLVYFGFASCPDICPTTLADTRLAFSELGDRASSLDLAVATIDPERDSEEIISSYVEAFIPSGVALRTDDQVALFEAAAAFGVFYEIATNDDGEIEVGHTPNLFVVDDAGALVLTWPFGVTTDDMVSDLTILLDRA